MEEILFEVEVNYDTCSIEIDDIPFSEGCDEIQEIFNNYFKMGLTPRIGEEIIPMVDGFDVSVTIKSICYCNHKVMVQCDCN